MKWLAAIAFVLGACSANPSFGPSVGSRSELGRGPGLPPATEALHLDGSAKKAEPTCADLLAELTRVTGARFGAEKEVRASMDRAAIGFTAELVVPAANVWTVSESILVSRGYQLEILSRDPLLIDVASAEDRGRRTQPRNRATFVPPDELEAWAAHPAFLVQTIVDFDAINIRDLSNSMRQMFTDPMTQQIIPVGNTQTLILIGRAPAIFDLVAMLRSVERAEQDRCDRLGVEPETGVARRPKSK